MDEPGIFRRMKIPGRENRLRSTFGQEFIPLHPRRGFYESNRSGIIFRIASTICRMSLILIFLLISTASANDPSPESKQLHIGALTYLSGCDDEIWNNDVMRNWFANHYSWTAYQVGGMDLDAAVADIDAMHAINPNLKALYYDLYLRFASDTSDVQTWKTAQGITDSIYIRADNGAGDSLTCRISEFDSWTTTDPGEILLHSAFGETKRFAFDFRHSTVGAYLYYKYAPIMSTYHADGIFIDEFANTICTGNPSWVVVNAAPFNDTSSTYWAAGGPYDWVDPWGISLTSCDIRDSLAVLNAEGWGKVLGDSLAANGKIAVMNWASWGGPYAYTPGWDAEYRHMIAASGLGGILGEYCNYKPSLDGWEDNCNNIAYACSTVADSSAEIWVWPIYVGQGDSSAADEFTIARSRMNALGLMLDCLFPGTTTYRFGPHPLFGGGVCGGNAFIGERTLNGITLSDTTTDWDAAWGKYFGEPTFVRDESLTGVDGSGQSYTIHEIKLDKPTGGVLTLAVGRYCRGPNRLISNTQVNYNLPPGTWFELNSGGTWQQAGSSVGIANAHWRFFSSDTTLSNNGPGDTPADSLIPGKPTGVNAEPTDNGSFSIRWTAPADDGYDFDSGSVDHYEIRYSTDSVEVVNWTPADIFDNPPWPPSAPGQQDSCTIDNLMPGEIYYFGIKAFDEANNASPMSDIDKSFAGGIKPPTPDTVITFPSGYYADAYAVPVGSYLPISYEFAYDTSVFFQTQKIRFPIVIDTLVQVILDSLLEETVYYWRCRSIAYGQDSSVWANGSPFTLEGGTFVNAAPVITSPDTASAFADSMFCYDVTVDDPDGPTLIISYENTPSWLTALQPSSACGIPPFGSSDTTFVVIASDGIIADTLQISVAIINDGGGSDNETDAIHAFPNPFRAADGHSFITFTELPGNSKISISTISGNIVRAESDMGPGDWVWDVKNDNGKNLASGVYLYVVEYPGGHYRDKVMVIR